MCRTASTAYCPARLRRSGTVSSRMIARESSCCFERRWDRRNDVCWLLSKGIRRVLLVVRLHSAVLGDSRFGSMSQKVLSLRVLRRSLSAVARSGAKRAWHKINFSNSERGLVQNQFHWLQLYKNESELIRIPGFVPCNFCRVLLHIQPSRQNRHSR